MRPFPEMSPEVEREGRRVEILWFLPSIESFALPLNGHLRGRQRERERQINVVPCYIEIKSAGGGEI